MRKWHRWISLVAALFLLSVGITGVILQFRQFFGEDEATKEKWATMTSAYKVDSRLDDFLPKLAIAQAAVKAKIGDDRLNGLELQLKGEHPAFILHTAGKTEQKFVVNADTGVIEKQSGDERESLLLRIHTGEVLGDGGVVGGMLWGMALIALTISGAWLYWQMYRARAKTKGWRKIFWLVPLAFATPHPAFAGSPFLTDDPGFAPKGWEIKFETIYEHDKGRDALTAPVVDINYSLTEHFKLNLTLVGKTFGQWYVYTEVGYQFVFMKDQSDSIIHGLAAQYQLTEK